MGTLVAKKYYEKPLLQDVKLRLEEAVLGDACKLTATGTGPEGACTEGMAPCSATLGS